MLNIALVRENSKDKEMITQLIRKAFGLGNRYASLTDIKGNKSGGTRDAGGVDWRKTGGPDTN
jgi:hypothetical protein